jgi:hypothetical protein
MSTEAEGRGVSRSDFTDEQVDTALYLHGAALAMRDESGVAKGFTVLRSAGPSVAINWQDLLALTEAILGCKHGERP